MQAIRSHIHFSQLSAWLSRSKGSIPSQVIYRLVYEFTTSKAVETKSPLGGAGAQWCGGESTCLPPMYLRFESRHDQVCSWFSALHQHLVKGFFARFFSIPAPTCTKTNISKFQFNLETVDEEPPHGYTYATK